MDVRGEVKMRFTVRTLMAPISLIALMALVFRLVGEGREAAQTGYCIGQLKQYGLALMNYETVFGCFPPAITTDRAGTPCHSWRVAPLHVWHDHSLYGLSGFNVPWNHKDHAWLLAYDTPAFFWWCPSGDGRATKMTDYVAVIGDQTAWPRNRGRKRSEITDDPASTILVLEIADSRIHWMEPRDPTLDEVLSSGLSSHHGGFVNALFVDGQVRKIRTDISRETLKALLTVSGGEVPDPASWMWRVP
jgi:prepilin-type processing-associated H-X9-DG protein